MKQSKQTPKEITLRQIRLKQDVGNSFAGDLVDVFAANRQYIYFYDADGVMHHLDKREDGNMFRWFKP